MKKKKRRRKDSDIVLPPLPEGVTKEDIARALVRSVERTKPSERTVQPKKAKTWL